MKWMGLLLGACTLAVVLNPAAAQWSMEVVDATPYAGLFSDLQLDSAGRPHVAYYTALSGEYELRYARRDGSLWDIQTVDPIGSCVGYGVALALDSADRPHIAYQDRYSFKYAVDGGAGWSITELDHSSGYNMGRWPGLVVDSHGYCRATYYENNVVNKYAVQDAAGWDIEAPLGAGTSGGWVAIAIDAADAVHLAGATGNGLVYAVRAGDTWSVQTGISRGGMHCDIVLDSQGHPHIAHGENNVNVLRYTWWDGSQWHTEEVDTRVCVFGGASLALDANDRPRISYIFGLDETVRHARRIGDNWHIDSVPSVCPLGSYGTSLVINDLNESMICFYDNDTGLHMATGIPEPAALFLLGAGGLMLIRRRT